MAQKLPTFLVTTALQRSLYFSTLDFSPLRHSSAFTKHKNYTTIRSELHSEILENLSRGERDDGVAAGFEVVDPDSAKPSAEPSHSFPL